MVTPQRGCSLAITHRNCTHPTTVKATSTPLVMTCPRCLALSTRALSSPPNAWWWDGRCGVRPNQQRGVPQGTTQLGARACRGVAHRVNEAQVWPDVIAADSHVEHVEDQDAHVVSAHQVDTAHCTHGQESQCRAVCQAVEAGAALKQLCTPPQQPPREAPCSRTHPAWHRLWVGRGGPGLGRVCSQTGRCPTRGPDVARKHSRRSRQPACPGSRLGERLQGAPSG